MLQKAQIVCVTVFSVLGHEPGVDVHNNQDTFEIDGFCCDMAVA